jgi:hypothetical protein
MLKDEWKELRIVLLAKGSEDMYYSKSGLVFSSTEFLTSSR